MQPAVHQAEHTLFIVLLQLIVMIAAARAVNMLFRRLRQPGVIGEIVAGLLLGPSLFGHVFPNVSQALFGAGTGSAITIIAQIGLILLMFQIGSDFEFGHLSTPRNRNAVVLIACVSVAVPLLLGIVLGTVSAPRLAPGTSSLTYSLFVGVGLAITAVPILGRILREYGLTRAELGVVAIAAAAINDVVGWILLAIVSAFASASLSAGSVLGQLAGLVAFVLVMWFVLRPLAGWLVRRYPEVDGELPPVLIAIVICLVFAAGICTFKLGIFAIFGGFAAGLLFHPYERFVLAWRRQVGQFVLVFFLPVFFTFTGLRTNVLGLSSGADLAWLAAILVFAVAGKMIPVYGAARLSGFDHHEGLVLGTLMNTRALMELIVLNIGYDSGFIPQKVFTMLVIMAVVTTLMAGPLLKRVLPRTGHQIPDGVEA